MISPDILAKSMEAVIIKYGLLGTLILILLQFVVIFIVNLIKNEARVPTERYLLEIRKTLQDSSNQLIERYKKEIELLFRDEEIRKSARVQILNNANDVRIKIYKQVYELFFDVMYGLAAMRKANQVDRQKIDALHDQVSNARKDIFINSVQLGRLTDFLLHAQIALWDDIQIAVDEHKSPWQNQGIKMKVHDASEQIGLAEKWLQEQLMTTATIKDFELDDSVLAKLKEGRNKLIAEAFSV